MASGKPIDDQRSSRWVDRQRNRGSASSVEHLTVPRGDTATSDEDEDDFDPNDGYTATSRPVPVIHEPQIVPTLHGYLLETSEDEDGWD